MPTAQEHPNFVTHLGGPPRERYGASQVHGLSRQDAPPPRHYDLDALVAISEGGLPPRGWLWLWGVSPRTKAKRSGPGEVITPSSPQRWEKRSTVAQRSSKTKTGFPRAPKAGALPGRGHGEGAGPPTWPCPPTALGAMAAYASRAGLHRIFCPSTPEVNVSEIALQAEVYRVNGLINDCGKVVGDGKETAGWSRVDPKGAVSYRARRPWV